MEKVVNSMRGALGSRFAGGVLLGLALLLLLAGSASGQVTRERVLVGFMDRPGPRDTAAVRSLGGAVIASYQHLPMIAAELPSPAVQHLKRSPRVRFVAVSYTHLTLPTKRIV